MLDYSLILNHLIPSQTYLPAYADQHSPHDAQSDHSVPIIVICAEFMFHTLQRRHSAAFVLVLKVYGCFLLCVKQTVNTALISDKLSTITHFLFRVIKHLKSIYVTCTQSFCIKKDIWDLVRQIHHDVSQRASDKHSSALTWTCQVSNIACMWYVFGYP